MSKINTKMLTTLGALLALEIVLSRFLSISAWNVKIGLSFIPVVFAAMYYGSIPAAVLAALGDLLGATLFPTGPYFPGFTLTAALTGWVYGWLLYRKNNLVNTVAAVVLSQLVLSLLLNTYWLHVLYGTPFSELLAVRIVQAELLSVAKFVTIRALYPLLDRLKGRVPA